MYKKSNKKSNTLSHKIKKTAKKIHNYVHKHLKLRRHFDKLRHIFIIIRSLYKHIFI